MAKKHDGKMLPKYGPTSDVIVNWYLKLSTRVEIFELSTKTLLEYSSISGTRMHPYYWLTPTHIRKSPEYRNTIEHNEVFFEAYGELPIDLQC